MKKAISIAITLLMLMSGMLFMTGGSTGSENNSYISFAPENSEPMLTAHAPISIDNDTDFANQAASEGWSGSGTQADPYIIENYDITGDDCIDIGNTMDYFVVRNCSLHGAYSGIALYNVQNGTLFNNTASNNDYGIYLYSSSNNTISYNTASYNYGDGIYLYSSSNNTISYNTVSWNYDYSIYLEYFSNNNTISYNNASSNIGEGIGIYLYLSSNNIISNNTASNNYGYYDSDGIYYGIGIYLYLSSNNIISNNTASNNNYSIYLHSSSNNIISNNTASNNDYGIYLHSSSNNTISNNTANSNNWDGIWLWKSSNNTISNNTASNNWGDGICVDSSSNNSISNNIASNNWGDGICVDSSSTNTISTNTMVKDGIFIEGDQLSYWNTHKIDTSNTVNGKPVYYWKNMNSGTVPAGAGEVILANCTNIILDNQNVSDSTVGIEIGFSSHCTIRSNTASKNYDYYKMYGIYLYSSSNNIISNNTASNNDYGIYLYSSSNNTISNNTASNNHDYYEGYGIYLYSSSSNTISDNTISNNITSNNHDYYKRYGIYLDTSSSNTISNNTISNNIASNNYGEYDSYGIYLDSASSNTIINNTISNNNASNNWGDGIYLNYSSSNTIINNTVSNNECGIYLNSSSDSNLIYHNNFINNINQAYDSGLYNQWHNGYPSGGNYWSDYSGNDSYQGENQDIPGSDAIGDTPYSVSGSIEDKYPLIFPWGFRDTDFPGITITAPSNGSFVWPNPFIEWNGWDNTSGINHYAIRLDNDSWENISANITYHEFNGLAGGKHSVYVKAIDAFGNENTTSVTIDVDATPPEVQILEPLNHSFLNTHTVNLSWEGNDSISGIAGYLYAIYDWDYVGTNTSHTLSLQDGSYTAYVEAVDGVGNMQTVYVTFTVDTTPPTVNITDPVDGFISGSDTITIHWTGDDYYGEHLNSGSGIDFYEIRIDNGTWNNTGKNTTYSFSNLSEGSHTVKVRATDRAGNENTEKVTFTVDLSKPAINITSPANDAVFGTGEVTVWWIGNDTLSGIGHYEVRIDSGPWQNVGNNSSYFFRGLSDGFHTIDVKAVDVVGNYNITSVTFSVGYGIISGKVVDENGNPIANATVTLDSGQSAVTDENGVFRIIATKGAHTVTIAKSGYETQAVDTSVNSGETTNLHEVSLASPSNANSGDLTWILIFVGVLGLAAIIFMLLVYKGIIDPENLMGGKSKKKGKK